MLTNARKQELRRGVAILVDLAWREGHYAAPRAIDCDHDDIDGLDALKDEELAYARSIVGRITKQLTD